MSKKPWQQKSESLGRLKSTSYVYPDHDTRDVANPKVLRRSNTSPLSRPGVEPMDLDISPDHYRPRPPSASIPPVHFGRAERYITSSPSPVGGWQSPSWPIDSGRSSHSSRSKPSKAEFHERPSSAPVIIGSANNANNQRTINRVRTSLGLVSRPSRLSSDVPSSDNRRHSPSCSPSRKKGYGIPETDAVFSHYPKFPAIRDKLSSPSPSFRQSSIADSMTRQSQNRNLKSKTSTDGDLSNPPTHSSTANHTREDKKGKIGCFCPLLILFLSSLAILITFYLPTLQFIYCKSAIRFNVGDLRRNLETELFGQHIAADMILDEVERYFNSFLSKHNYSSEIIPRTANSQRDPCKPLMLSFHGWTGVGKTFVSRLVSQAFHDATSNPLIIPLLFPHKSSLRMDADLMMRKITDSLSRCKVNVLIVDEMDKAPEGAVKGMSDVVRSLTSECSPWHPVVILLLSNTHATDINLLFKQELTSSSFHSVVREDVPATRFASVFKTKDKQWYDPLVDAKQVDAFVPFLPLEKKHAVQCIKRDLEEKGIPVTDDKVSAVLKELHFVESDGLIFSSTGCKRVSEKIDYVRPGMVINTRESSEL